MRDPRVQAGYMKDVAAALARLGPTGAAIRAADEALFTEIAGVPRSGCFHAASNAVRHRQHREHDHDQRMGTVCSHDGTHFSSSSSGRVPMNGPQVMRLSYCLSCLYPSGL